MVRQNHPTKENRETSNLAQLGLRARRQQKHVLVEECPL
jgi:hypothetical protein